MSCTLELYMYVCCAKVSPLPSPPPPPLPPFPLNPSHPLLVFDREEYEHEIMCRSSYSIASSGLFLLNMSTEGTVNVSIDPEAGYTCECVFVSEFVSVCMFVCVCVGVGGGSKLRGNI